MATSVTYSLISVVPSNENGLFAGVEPPFVTCMVKESIAMAHVAVKSNRLFTSEMMTAAASFTVELVSNGVGFELAVTISVMVQRIV